MFHGLLLGRIGAIILAAQLYFVLLMPKLNLHRRDYVSILGGDISADELEKKLEPHFEASE
ncbi:hypothetical protein O9992_26735 [Vibrio lentus]|nr:hypothetical protein [Vibrio lentus]